MSFIKFNNVSLDYFHYLRKNSLKKAVIKSFFKFIDSKDDILRLHRALDGINLTLKKGDHVGLIGKNGAGKSTLLRLVSGIYQPTSGSLDIQGSISSILDINVGLNNDATGYENIILVGILYGKTKREMKAKFEEIEEFTELKDFLKIPVRTYSSGMRLRLAFGIATSMESQILVIDEAIGVGDQNFIDKAHDRLRSLVHKSSILILASHSTDILKNFCNKVILLDQGKCMFFGELQEGIDLYAKSSLT